MVVVKVGGQRGRIMAQIEERNKKLRQKQELQYTREVYKKFDAVSSPDRPAGAVRWAPAPSPYPTALSAHGPDAASAPLGAPRGRPATPTRAGLRRAWSSGSPRPPTQP